MGKALHRFGLMIAGILSLGGGFGLRIMKGIAQESFGFTDATPVPIPVMLDGGAYLLFGLGGILILYGIVGIIEAFSSDEEQQVPPQQQPQQQPPGQQRQQPQQGQYQQGGPVQQAPAGQQQPGRRQEPPQQGQAQRPAGQQPTDEQMRQEIERRRREAEPLTPEQQAWLERQNR